MFRVSGLVYALLTATHLAHALPEQRLYGRQSQDARFKFFELPEALTGPCDIAEGPDGAIWGQGILLDHIFRVDPATGAVEDHRIPFTTSLSNDTIPIPGVLQPVLDRAAASCAIRLGADGNLYSANGVRNQLVRINPSTRQIKVFQPTGSNPAGNLQPFNDLYTAADGMWLTETTGNTFQFFDYKTERFTTYDVPTPLALPLGLYVASDGVVYIAELLTDKILTYDPKTAQLNEYTLPEPAQFPGVIRAEYDGWVYFSLFTGNGVGRINMQSHRIELFHTNQVGGLGSEVTIDAKHGVWLSFFSTNVMARLNTETLKFDYVPFPGTVAQNPALTGLLGDVPPYVDIAVNYGPGDAIWFTSFLKNAVGRYDLTGLF